MGSKYPILKPITIIRFLELKGFVFKSQKGSHMKYIKGNLTVIIPKHDEIAKYTLKSILKQANIDLDELFIWLGGC